MWTIEKIESWDDVADRLPFWDQLHRRLSPTNPFTSPLWTDIWFHTQYDPRRQQALLFQSTREGHEAFMVFSKEKTRRFILPAKLIETIGAGKSAADRHFVFLQEPLLAEPAIDIFWDRMRRTGGWNLMRIAPIPSSCRLLPKLAANARQHGLTVVRRPYAVGYKIRTAMGWEEYWRSRSRKFRKNLQNAVNKMRSCGSLRVESHSDPGRAEHLSGILAAITAKSWKRRQATDLFNPAYKGFWDQAFRRTLSSGNSAIWLLYDKDRPISYEWTLRLGDSLFSLKADYDEDYARLSPGNLVAWHVLQDGFQSGVSEVDYMMGGGDYKKAWATDRYELEELLVGRNKFSLQIVNTALSARQRIRALYRRLKDAQG